MAAGPRPAPRREKPVATSVPQVEGAALAISAPHARSKLATAVSTLTSASVVIAERTDSLRRRPAGG
jgi:hypothetical protein